MKKYFVQYLPVDGEIKEGVDKILFGGKIFSADQINYDLDNIEDFGRNIYIPLKNSKKVKLFLCSRDIKVGERFDSANGTGFLCSRIDDYKFYSTGGLSSDVEEVPHSKNYSYIIIGEVSPDALWVTEGMEFNEADLAWALATNDQFQDVITEQEFTDKHKTSFIKKYVKFRCPSSPNHFH